ncbi:two-component regulator propeller domain-containing protein [Cytophagaceae bacterium YF14B1]|uniref:histidine kinase n=1 Tax=Xanthocytophaga flava TaxID=3048013 RepID=A0AAE3QYM6_9BACT|nr:two-component regulator propeller domain-containing protein [Xanthocytophaga flavus]MDJ1485575.1 two-component regulator propeller domain-containing protein [Xanthocytophaga flavus]
MHKSFLLSFVFYSVLLHYSFCQPPKITFQHLTMADGLSQSDVLSICQDSQGFLWLGTHNGLNRYSGANMTVYRNDPHDSTSLSGNDVRVIFEDHLHQLWVGTTTGLNRYNPRTNTFTQYKTRYTTQIHSPKTQILTSLSDYGIEAIAEDQSGNLWIATYHGGLNRYNRTQDNFTRFRHRPGDARSLIDDYLTGLYVDKQGNLWIGTEDKGLDLLRKGTNTFVHYPSEGFDSVNSPHIASIVEDNQGNLWLGTFQGLICFNSHTGKVRRYTHDPADEKSLSSDKIYQLLVDDKGQLWVGVENGGLHLFDPATEGFTHYLADFLEPESLSNNTVSSLYQDRSGTIWAGVHRGGVNYFHRGYPNFRHYRQKATPNSLSHNNVKAFLEDQKGQLWIGTDGGGVNVFDPATDSFTHYRHKTAKGKASTSAISSNIISSDIILALLEDAQGQIWMGTWGGGVSVLNPRTGKWTHWLHDPKDSNTLIDNYITALAKDSQGNIWIGSTLNGISVYHPREKRFTHFTHTGRANSLVSNLIVFLYPDRKGCMWVGTYEGLSRYDPLAGRFTNYTHRSGDPDPTQLSHNTVRSMLEDSKGNYWFATDNGLNRFDPDGETFSLAKGQGQLFSTSIQSIQEDNQGNLWLGTLNGLSRYTIKNQSVTNYSVADGIQGEEFSVNAALKAKKGELFFGGFNGFSRFDPARLQVNTFIAPVVLTDFQIFNQPVPIGPGSALSEYITQAKEIHLSYEQNVFSFQFAALNFIAPQKNRYAYRMEEFDTDWIYAGNRRTATYTNLDPGRYVFRVKAANNSGVWNQKGTSVVLIIDPPFYKTWWFMITLAALLIGMAYTFYQVRLSAVKQQNRKLALLVEHRTEELKNANDDLFQRQEEINAQNEELRSANDELFQKQEENAQQRDLLETQNRELLIIRKQIEAQNQNLDQQVKERTKELTAFNQQLEQFAFITAHNLRAPVARILGLGQLLQDQGYSIEERLDFTDKMAFTAAELDQVVKDLNTILEFRKNATLSLTPIHLKEELKMIKANLANEITETGAEIIENFSQVETIYSLKPYVDSILLNLIHNAIKYRSPERKPYITIQTQLIDEFVCVIVRDNGLGIDLETYQHKLFTLYKRFHFHVEGKGLGLYLVKTQVLALGGKIEVESVLNQGTAFKVYLKYLTF